MKKSVLAAAALAFGLTALPSIAAPANAADRANDQANAALRQAERQNTGIYRAWFPDRATGRKAAISLHANLLESAWAQGYLVFELDGPALATLQRFGFRVEPAPDVVARRNALLDQIDAAGAGAGIQSIPGYACYETVEETMAAADAMVAAKPALASYVPVGPSWQKTQGSGGYDLSVLKLTNSAVPGDKPKLFINAAIHAREYTTAPLVLSFARWLVDGHGVDADATWLLDHHEVHLLLQSNPDGRKKAEAGLSWRKNTNNNYCFGNNIGADLNRNFSFAWNSTGGAGSSGNACDLTYRGPSPSSEPETQAIESYIRSLWPDRRGPNLNDPAPTDTQGLHLDIHSYSELVLWPWGATAAPAPNAAALQALGRRFAWFNGYTPTQSIGLYPTDGTTEGPSYGELGVPHYTFELGTSFFQSCTAYNNVIQPDNLKALIYAARIVRAPYQLPSGPDVTGLALSPASVPSGATFTVQATVTDERFNQSNGSETVQAIVGADAYIGVPPWAAGAVPHPLAAADGSFDSSSEAVAGTLPTVNLAEGKHIVYVQGRDAAGAAGPVYATYLTVGGTTPISLSATVTPRTERLAIVELSWGQAGGARVDVYRDGELRRRPANDGSWRDLRPRGTWHYQVCESGSTTVCSAEISVSY